jgi:hypothetical protein
MSYGADMSDLHGRAASSSSKFSTASNQLTFPWSRRLNSGLVINLKAILQQRVDEVIECDGVRS